MIPLVATMLKTKEKTKVVVSPKGIGDYLYSRLRNKGRVYQKKTNCSNADRLRFEHQAVGALLAALGINAREL